MDDPVDLLTIGLTTLDIAIHPVARALEVDEGALVETIRMSPAGTAGGTAMVAARLGLKVAIASTLGDDPQGQVVRSGLAQAGVNVDLLASRADWPTSTTVLPVRPDGQRATYHMVGASVVTPLPPEARALASRARAVHWGGVGHPGLAGQGVPLLAAARAAGALVTCDLIAPQDQALAELADLLPHVDVFMPSLAEVRVLAGTDDLRAAATRFMGMGARSCAFKLGAQGAVLFTPDREIWAPAFVIDPVDTTSCGDSFCAGLITGRLHGWDDAACLDLAMAVAARVAMGVGTLGALDDLAETQAFARTAERVA